MRRPPGTSAPPTRSACCVWDQLNSGGFVSDAWIYTGSNSAAVPECSSPPPIPTPQYNRTAAINWALAHAEDPQPYTSMCTWFVSNALWAGGLPQTPLWNNYAEYGSTV